MCHLILGLVSQCSSGCSLPEVESSLGSLPTHGLDVDVVMAHLTGVNVHPPSLSESQEGAEA